jgi:outer membrane protein assembly factor BamB
MPLLWKHYTGYTEDNTSAPIVGDDRVFFAASEVQQNRYVHHLYCLDSGTGALMWKFNPRSKIIAGPAYHEGIVYVGTEDGKFYALDAATMEAGGSGKWSFTVPRSIRGAPTIVEGRVIFGSSDRKVYILDAKTGEQKWSGSVSGDVTAAIAYGRDAIYVPCSSGEIFALTLDGDVRWRRRVTVARLEVDLVVSDDHLYVVSGFEISALALDNGVPRWSQRTAARITAAPAVAKAAVYISSRDGTVYALKPANGEPIWQQNLGSAITSAPLATKNAVLIGTRGPFLFALDAKSGKPLWKYRGWAPYPPFRGARYQIAGAPVTAQGALYVLSTDGNLYAFSPKSIDAQGPSMIAISPQEGQTIRGWPPITLRVNIFDEGSGLDESSISVALDGEAKECKFDTTNGICTVEIKAVEGREQPLPDGPHTLKISAKDAFGHAGEYALVFYTKQAL